MNSRKNSQLKEKSVTQEQNSRIRPIKILEVFSEEIMEKSRKTSKTEVFQMPSAPM